MHDHALFQAVCNSPEDQSLRLIAADWFEDQGDEPRADFIRRQCELASLPAGDPRAAALLEHVQRLLVAHRRRWNAPIHRFLGRGPLRNEVRSRRGRIRGWGYRRGFVEYLSLEAGAFADHADILFQLGPLRKVRMFPL